MSNSKKRAALDSDSPEGEEEVAPSKSSKKAKTAAASGSSGGVDAEGNPFWEVSALDVLPSSGNAC